ncbi:type I pullulanase [Clostridium sp. AL.422]|uniref:type I pullulanase n=1 Tax=Clostridium TaxID=1485 RepID=UPI00293DD520|nr:MULTISPECIES: type I pullulanase [unclassified Clostridium]MDV4151475.1 type I pullulanase [Clostridium sp. AL.422]
MFNFFEENLVKEFDELYKYDGELGAIYNKEKTIFRVWAPNAQSVKIIFRGNDGYLCNKKYKDIKDMKYKERGLWEIEVVGDLHGEYYNYIIKNNGIESEVVDPYAKSVGVNGNIGMVIDLERTNPIGWESHKIPKFQSHLDSIIYEVHIRDFTIDYNSGVKDDIKGKFKGFHNNTAGLSSGIKTGINHLKELGVNVIQLLPAFDYKTVNEMYYDEEEYNWGYDPLNYNVPEGSYSTNPYDGEVRIREFKELIMNLHELGFKVVMDVVFNHTADTENSNFNKIVPKYYYRFNKDGSFSNGSGCGNELASERTMVRKFILDSVKYWVKEYKIDGFRFDLMGLHDIETMKSIRSELNDGVLIYGEGWKAGESPLHNSILTLKENIKCFGNIQVGAFSDDIRDAIKGSVFEVEKGGFINGGIGFEETIKFGIVASTNHKDIDFNKLNYSKKPWANEPYQVITYTSAHDNYTLWDKLSLVESSSTIEERIRMNKLAAAIILTSQGIPFIHSGDEILRSKEERDGTLVENSYKSSDYVNKFNWSKKEKYLYVFNYYKSLIELRKNHKIFKMDSSNDINKNISFLKFGKNFKDENIVGYIAEGDNVNDPLGKIVVIFNGNKHDVEVELEHNRFIVVLDYKDINENGIYKINDSKIKVKGISALILRYDYS